MLFGSYPIPFNAKCKNRTCKPFLTDALAMRSNTFMGTWQAVWLTFRSTTQLKYILGELTIWLFSLCALTDLKDLKSSYALTTITGVVGFEPTYAAVKVVCLTAWRYPNNGLFHHKIKFCNQFKCDSVLEIVNT